MLLLRGSDTGNSMQEQGPLVEKGREGEYLTRVRGRE